MSKMKATTKTAHHHEYQALPYQNKVRQCGTCTRVAVRVRYNVVETDNIGRDKSSKVFRCADCK